MIAKFTRAFNDKTTKFLTWASKLDKKRDESVESAQDLESYLLEDSSRASKKEETKEKEE